MSNVNATEQVPAGGGVSTPDSGAFGEKAALARLEAAIPQAEAEAEAQQGAASPPADLPLPPPAGGLPKALFAPSRQPDVPASAPMTPQEPPPSTPTERVMRALEMLADGQNTDVSRTTRTWAMNLLESLKRE